MPKEKTGVIRPRKIIGLSLPPSIAEEVKAEAMRRKISLRDLFIELWASYTQRRSK